MRWTLGISLFLSAALTTAPAARANETDQYTVPPKPLVDVGASLGPFVEGYVQRVADDLNAKFAERIARAAVAGGDRQRELLSSAAELLTKDEIARAVNARSASSDEVFERFEKDFLKTAAAGAPRGAATQFAPALADSIYGGTPFTLGLYIVPISPTVRAYGVQFGTDKLDHFFREGYAYYREYRKAQKTGSGEVSAVRRAVNVGVTEESTVFGNWADGIYSNADLAANYAGFQFYLNLTRPVRVDGKELPPILLLVDQRWVLNPAARGFMRHYVTDHLDESLNPSRYEWSVRSTVWANVRSRGRAWAAYRHLTPERLARLDRLWTWYGADYGRRGDNVLVPSAGWCAREGR